MTFRDWVSEKAAGGTRAEVYDLVRTRMRENGAKPFAVTTLQGLDAGACLSRWKRAEALAKVLDGKVTAEELCGS